VGETDRLGLTFDEEVDGRCPMLAATRSPSMMTWRKGVRSRPGMAANM